MHEERYWQAVLERDSSSNGIFVYAVRSTGIYCNPSCPSRRPQREQVLFFTQPEAAEQAGFRPCKRCHPREAEQDGQVGLVQQACRYIEEHLERGVNLDDIGASVHMSPFHLQRVFKRVMGITPRQYADARRLAQFKAHVKEGESVTQAMYEAGYSSSSRLYERTSTQLGMTPAIYRRGGPGMSITYTIVDSPLGRLLVGATEKGVCSVCIGNDDARLEAILREEYPRADVRREADGARLNSWVQVILEHLNGTLPHLDLPLDVQATAFQRRVWDALQHIPYGETRSYSQIAQSIGQPKATRAVANACASNPVAIAIPCHRVVRGNGESGGYRWGVERKQKLLKQEAEHLD